MKTLMFHLRQVWEKLQYLFKFLYRRTFHTPLNGIYDPGNETPLEYTIRENPWGAFKIPEKDRRYFRITKFYNAWCFRSPSRNYGVIGYPSLTMHWVGRRIDDIAEFSIRYDVRLEVERFRKYNLSFDFWVGTSSVFSFPKVTHEVMVWEDYRVAMPFGKYVETVKIGGQDYRVYTGYIDKSSENLGIDGWQYTAFLKIDRTHRNHLYVDDILRYMQEKEMIAPRQFLMRCEFGNEVYNANGAMEILDYRKHLTTR